jgi:hypothetical protein
MVTDIQNSLISKSSTEAISVSRQNQQTVLQLGQKAANSNSSEKYNFPDNDEIAAKTAIVLEQLDLGQSVKRGSIVNILV